MIHRIADSGVKLYFGLKDGAEAENLTLDAFSRLHPDYSGAEAGTQRGAP